MKEQFVTYEIALKLKELGFDEKCLGYFNNTENLTIGIDVPDKSLLLTNKGKAANACLAPLWQQAISFLKEKKVLIAERWDGWEYGDYDWEDFLYSSTKEKAILKAIEIVKNRVTEM